MAFLFLFYLMEQSQVIHYLNITLYYVFINYAVAKKWQLRRRENKRCKSKSMECNFSYDHLFYEQKEWNFNAEYFLFFAYFFFSSVSDCFV